jgi:hypothetical protein
MDEATFGVQHQLNNSLGMGARFIWREWGNFIDDVLTFNANGTPNRTVANVEDAQRNYRGLEFSLDKRFSNNWAASGSYTWSKTRGNHFGDDFTILDDYEDAQCRSTVDTALGTFPCSEIQSKLFGTPTYDLPHMLKFAGSYRRPIGAFDVTAGFVGTALSKPAFSKSRSVSVLIPGTTTQATTMTYFYEGRGSDRLEGMSFVGDLALEGVYRAMRRSEIGVKFETFNLFNTEDKIGIDNVNWCLSQTGSCATTRANFGKATTRNSFIAPRTYRFTFLFRF